MSLLLASSFFGNTSRSVTRPSNGNNIVRSYAKAAKTKAKSGKGTKAKPLVKKVLVSKTELRKRSVVLTTDVAGVGQKGEEIRVSRGFARNFLFPRQAALIATDEIRAEYAPFLENIDFHQRAREADLKGQRKRVSKVLVKIRRHQIDGGLPIHHVSKENVIEKLYKQYKIELEPDQLDMKAPIERYGNYDFPVKIGDQAANLKISVTPR